LNADYIVGALKNFLKALCQKNADYIVGALKKFLKAICQKRPNMVSGEWMFHWDNAPYTRPII
jgi:hypothetical protein